MFPPSASLAFMAILLAGRSCPAGGESPVEPSLPAALPGALPAAYERSLKRVKEALAVRPDDPRLWMSLGDVHQRQGRLRDALPAFQTALKLDPSHPDPLLRLGEIHLRLDEHERAEESYRALLRMGPAVEVPAHVGLAEVFYQMGKYGPAAEELRAALGAGGKSAEFLYLLARALETGSGGAPAGTDAASGEARAVDEEVVRVLEEAIRMDPSHASARYLLGMAFRRQGKEEAARTELAAFRRLKGLRAEAREKELLRSGEAFEALTEVELGRAFLEAKDPRAALEHARRAVLLQPELVEALALEGLVLLRLDRPEEASAAYRRALARDPAHAASLWNLGRIHLRAGRRDEGAPLLVRAAEIRKAFPEGWELLARLAQDEGLYPERAEEFARNALEQRPSPANLARLVRALRKAGKVEESGKLLRSGRERFPDAPELEEGGERLPGGESSRR